MIVMSLLPGIPMLPFMALGAGAGMLAFVIQKRTRLAAAAEANAGDRGRHGRAPAEEPISTALKIDDLKIELGYALLPLVNAPDGSDRLTEQIKALRRSLASEMGFVMPAVRILDNVQLEANAYIIKLKEVDAGQGRIWPNQHMVMDPAGAQVQPARPAHHRADLRPARHLGRRDAQGRSRDQGLHGGRCRDRARDAPHRSAQDQHVRAALLRARCRSCSRTCRRSRANWSRTSCRRRSPSRASSACCSSCSPSASRSATCRPSWKASRTALAFTRNPTYLVEHVRTRLARQICAQHTSPNGYLPLIALSAKWEQAFAESIVGQGEDKSLAMAPSRLSEFITLMRERFEDAAREGEAPVLVTSPGVRPFVRSIVERFRTQTTVLSQSEIHPRARLKTVGGISERPSHGPVRANRMQYRVPG